MSVNVNLNGINQVNFDLDGTTTAVIAAPGVTAITNRSNAITQLTGDVEAGPGYGSVTATVVGVNGASVPASSSYVGTNSSKQIITATTPLLPANNLSDVSSTTTARTNLGLGTMAVQNADDVAITGGTIDGTPIGTTTASTVAATTVTASSYVLGRGLVANNIDPSGGTSDIIDHTALVGWNVSGGNQEVDFINVTSSPGGFNFYNTTAGVGPTTPVATISSSGAITGESLSIKSGGGGKLTFQDGTTQSTAATGSGTVTSVGLSVPSWQTVSGSPVTSSGTLTVSDNNQTANEVFAGPSSGSAAAPTFRALVPADLPLATTSAFGAVKPDGTTITISSGVISAPSSGGYSLGGNFTTSNVSLGTGAGGGTLDTVAGLDGSHMIQITTGSSVIAASTIWTGTFTISRGHTTYPIVTVANGPSTLNLVVMSGATSYSVECTSALAANSTYTFFVSCP